jgi:hypothetical protein
MAAQRSAVQCIAGHDRRQVRLGQDRREDMTGQSRKGEDHTHLFFALSREVLVGANLGGSQITISNS